MVGSLVRGGVVGSTDFQVIQRGAGANMSVDISMPAGGMAYVKGSTISNQGYYAIPVHASTINEVIAAASGTNPRIDSVILHVFDNTIDSTGFSLAQTEVLTGTATSGATLSNRTGAATIPANCLLLADVLVPTSSTSVVTANINDKRLSSSMDGLPGQLVATAATTADFGYILCDGSAVSRHTYAALFARISTTFGTGDGSTTFNLPDLRGRAPVGPDPSNVAGRLSANNGLGQSSGEEKHQLTTGELASHTHSSPYALAAVDGNNVTINVMQNWGTGTGGGSSGSSNGTGSDTPHNNMQPYLCVNWQIKY